MNTLIDKVSFDAPYTLLDHKLNVAQQDNYLLDRLRNMKLRRIKLA